MTKIVWATSVLLTPEAEPLPLGRPHPVSYPVSYIACCIGRINSTVLLSCVACVEQYVSRARLRVRLHV